MITRNFFDKEISLLGFGAMRLPLIPGDPLGTIDEVKTQEMIDYALANGVNYIDTAYPYHNCMSEPVLGRALEKHPRESYYLATKYPGHQYPEIRTIEGVAEIFEKQLSSCKTDYFDFYLLHNVYEEVLDLYTDPEIGIIDYFLEQKRLGRIHHFGFSTHLLAENLESFLAEYGDKFEFCQIQLNYMDWTLQNGKDKVESLTKYGLPMVIMEPLRGGRLAKLSDENEAKLKALRPEASIPSWSFRWLQEVPGIMTILSGMSALDQVEDNIAAFQEYKPLTETEREQLYAIADSMKSSVPCTGCRYCVEGCPMELDIPMLLRCYNESKFMASMNLGMTIDSLPEDKRPAACIACGKCAHTCPQKIDIPAALKDFDAIISKVPHWADICRERAEAARKAAEAEKK